MILVKLFISFLVLISTAEQAYAFFPKSSPQQKSFVVDIKKSNYKSALAKFESTFSASFKTSPTGYAFYYLLSFKAGLKLNSLQHLLSLKNLKSIDPQLRKTWAKEVPMNSPLWKVINLNASSHWNSIFPFIGQYNGPLFPHYNPKNLKSLHRLARKKMNSAIMKDWHFFQLGLWYGIFDQPQKGLSYFNKISKKSVIVSRDEVQLAIGRTFYQLKDRTKAVQAYQHVSQKSDVWALSLEEQAWAYTLMKKDNLSLSKLKSLFSPVLLPFAGPEPFMLTAFNQERNCDYVSSFKTVSKYKKHFLPRAISLKKIAQGQNTPAITKLMNVHKSNPLHWSYNSEFIKDLPSHYSKDKFLVKLLNGRFYLTQENLRAQKLALRQQFRSKIINYAKKRIPYLENKTRARLKFLAQRDLNEISNITKKMHLIESEVIQQLHIEKEIKTAAKFKRPKSKEVMVFPDDGEVWLDEIDKYTASIGLCQKNKGKSL